MPHSRLLKKPHTIIDAEALLAWYDTHARVLPWRISPAARARGTAPDPYHVWLSEIMLQQTTVAAATDYYGRFLARWPALSDLAGAGLGDVLSAWAGLGYYARARNLHACARGVADAHRGRFPRTAVQLAALPGIGPYTSAAISAICWDEPVAVIDGNVERVMARLGALKVPVREARAMIRMTVQSAVPDRAGDFAQGFMDLGTTICTPRRARCGACPLSAACAAKASGNPLAFPVRPSRTKRPVRHGHAFVLMRTGGAVWLHQRPQKGLLGAMTGVPTSHWGRKRPVDFPLGGDWHNSGHIVHVFTHFRLELDVWVLTGLCAVPPGPGQWVAPGELADAALPSVFRKVLAIAGLASVADENAAGHEGPAAGA